MSETRRNWAVYGTPVFVLDQFRSIHLLEEPIDGFWILFGIWNPDNLPDF